MAPPVRDFVDVIVTKVELSFTGAGNWVPARLEVRREPYAWQNWSREWTVDPTRPAHATSPGRRTPAGNVQP